MFQQGQQIGTYKLIRKLGRGGFGEVWLAERKSKFVTKKVAVKLPLDDQINFESIRQEAELWEQASGHPNVLPIIDADEYDGQVVIVSEYANGGSLADKIKAEGKLSLKQAVEITIGVLNGLDFLHSKHIIHRDIKPQNILLQGETPRLADFGISRAMNTSTISSAIVGTDAYMSPESFQGKRNVQTDIWSVGVLLYALIADNLPFRQDHPSERMFAILTSEPEPLSNEIPQKLREIVQKALAKLPENRYKTAQEMRGDLQIVLVNINHPSFAKTEIFHNPMMPAIEKETLSIETSQIEIPTIQTDEKVAQTKIPVIQPTQPGVQINESFSHQFDNNLRVVKESERVSMPSIAEKTNLKPIFWGIISIVALGILTVGGIGGAIWLKSSANLVKPVANSTAPTSTTTITAATSISPTIIPSISPSISPAASPMPNASNKQNEKSKPTVNKVAEQNPVKTPQPLKTAKPKPTQDPHCILTNSCQ